ncbi:sce7725 family protein [Acinetobacter shaoyimingii]|uniref:Sce7725 family protein n=1 Tax=Acinetobacter shaoyimingii TaxID=2715164 RepID=A0A6G8RSB6_9GAMM|nr:sce7725 family protein [Acinetobacter shaoyimingii]QIO04710.1 sce7725 family protein [Acinetobacter shaoyimingii]
MYYPILRGKLNELLALRELSELNLKYFTPVIEPVKKDIKQLIKTIEHLNKNSIEPYIIINPSIGEYSHCSEELFIALNKFESISYQVLYSINQETKNYEDFLGIGSFGLFIQKGIDNKIIDFSTKSMINFIQNDVNPNVKKLINNKVIYEDFFRKQKKNADYPKESQFSSIHSYFTQENNVIGFSDYTITGDDFNENGGPAYVVTIHCSYIDKNRFDELFIRHYSSTDDGTPTNPGAKFIEALSLLIDEVNEGKIPFTNTNALNNFKYLHKIEHFPGLGQIKKISIKHHIETINNFLSVPFEVNR